MSHALNGNGNGAGHGQARPQTPPVKPPNPAGRENSVAFRSADGVQRHGVIVRVMPHTAFFEVYDPTMILRLSETLQDFQVTFHGRTTCRGRAVVYGIVESGFKTACEVNLQEMNWTLDPIAALKQTPNLDQEFQSFLEAWQDQCRLRPGFKDIVLDLLSFLTDANVWLNRVELDVRNLPSPNQPRAEHAALAHLEPMFIRAIMNMTDKLEHELNHVEPDQRPLYQAFVRKFLHPLTQCSPFMHRAFEKPLGYAGDYEVVDMMFRSPFQGGSYFAKLLNAYALQLPPVGAHRNRILYLQKKLEDESLRMLPRNGTLRVFNLGCGPAREVQEFVAASQLANHASFVLADFEEKTLAHTEKALDKLKARHQRRAAVKTVKLSVAQLIREHERREKKPRAEQYDFIYCAGLFDYLTDAVCQRLMDVFYALLAPEGLLVATNVDRHRAINQMECFLDWHLQYRDARQMRELTPRDASPGDVVVKCDPSGANVFIEVRKPTASGHET